MRKNLFISEPDRTLTYSSTEEQPLTITLWVHGTRLFSRPLFQRHFQSTPGVTRAHQIDSNYTLHTIAQTLIEADPRRFCHEHFYIFSWSGKLCFDEREVAAHALNKAICDLLGTYHEQGLKPRLRIIGHSHGGNVVLNIAQIKDDTWYVIDELILLACPVQAQTKHLIKDPIFKQIYVLYSALDIIQILDPQGMYKHKSRVASFFSKRQFLHQENLAQMKVKVNRRAITHSEFSHPPFLKLLPRILDEIDRWHENIVYKEDPDKICKLLCVYTDRKPPKKDRSTA